MNKRIRLIRVVTVLLLLLPSVACKKYLDKKPVQSLAVPSTLADLQAVLDNTLANVVTPYLSEYVADNFTLPAGIVNGFSQDLRKMYTWDADALLVSNHITWSSPYMVVYDANFVLDILPTIQYNVSEQQTYNTIKGTALYHRAFMFHQLAQLFCKPYDNASLQDPGIVIKTKPTVNEISVRATVEETYKQIINDFKEAADLLPATQTANTRPVRASALGQLARVYLSMRDYVNAELYADQSLAAYNTLIDYNTLSPASVLPVDPLANKEILFISGYNLASVFSSNYGAIVDPALYSSYSTDDLRRTTFFGTNANGAYWKGSYFTYYGNYSIFDGVATDEVYLIRAESRARNAKVNEAMDDLNTLLRKRYRTGTFTDLVATSSADALSKILPERRKELCFRGLRWSDLRRFNLEGTGITLTRALNSTTYTLPPNDLRWVLLIPPVEVQRSGFPQNPR